MFIGTLQIVYRLAAGQIAISPPRTASPAGQPHTKATEALRDTTVTDPGDAAINDLLARAEEIRVQTADAVAPMTQRALGQFFTPRRVAEMVVAQVTLPVDGTMRVLDPGAGTGSLMAALIARVIRERPNLRVAVTAVEVDPFLADPLRRTLHDCAATAAALNCTVDYTIIENDFVPWAANLLPADDLFTTAQPERTLFDIIVQNPPYGKIKRDSVLGRTLNRLGIAVPNLYAAFLTLSIDLLVNGGQLAAITPRSFTNGTYYRLFRKRMLAAVGICRICVFHSRDSLFADSAVLQENIILAATKGRFPAQVLVSSAQGMTDSPLVHTVRYNQVVHAEDPEAFIRIPTDTDDQQVTETVEALPATLSQLELQVATGRVVDFRVRDALRDSVNGHVIPLIYPGNLREGRVRWPIHGYRKPQALAIDPVTQRLTLPAQTYVLVKRFSAKEERRRIVASVFHPEDVPANQVCFENHLNVFHVDGHGIDLRLAIGLALWLNSTTLDLHFRQFSGHTQVNATDLRRLRYPAAHQLHDLADAVAGRPWPDQAEIDALVHRHVLPHSDKSDPEEILPSSTDQDIAQARDLLVSFNFDAERSNERSALVLRALAG